MAFDFTQLDGFRPEMTADEKLALLDKYEPQKPDMTGFIAKSAFDKTASDLAEAKRQLKAKMTEDEQKEAERLANEAALKAELETLRRETTISKHRADFIGLGYDEKLAEDTAKALTEGDMAKFFANQKAHQDALEKAAKAAALASGKEPPAGHNEPPKGDKAKLVEQYNEAEKRYASSKNFNELVLMQSLDAQIRALPKT